jgi:hypothetical protein
MTEQEFILRSIRGKEGTTSNWNVRALTGKDI